MIDVMEASQDWLCDHFGALISKPPGDRSARSSLPDRSMRTPLVEVGNVFSQHPTQVAFTDDEGVIQALLPDRSHPALGYGIGLRRSKRGMNLSDSEAP